MMSRDVLADFLDPPACRGDLTLGVQNLPAHSKEIVVMGGAQSLKPGDIGLQPPFCIRRSSPEAIAFAMAKWLPCPSFRSSSLRIEVSPDKATAMKRALLVILPHGRVERPLCGISINIDLIVLIALTNDPAFPLLDLRGQPRHVEVVQGLQPKLCIHSGSHGFGATDQDADLSGADIIEQALLRLGPFEVLHESDFRSWHTEPDKLIADPAVSRKSTARLDTDRAEIGKDHLYCAVQLIRLAVRSTTTVLRSLPPYATGIADQEIELVMGFVVDCRHDEAQVDRGVAAVGDHRQQNVIAGPGRRPSRISIALIRPSRICW
jgi:hypothetical protein